jgi:hypothetical protein
MRDIWQAIGECGHVLKVAHSEYQSRYFTKVGKRITCEHDDCRIEAKPELSDAIRCERVTGDEVEKRCNRQIKWSTPMGELCTPCRNHYVREGYLDEGEWEKKGDKDA